MIVYAESSSVLTWLLGEASQSIVLEQLRAATRVVSSTLTGVECARGLARARAMERISRADELAALQMLGVAESSWDVHDLSESIMKGARADFPFGPVRTLDALHLSTALVFYETFGELTMLSFDERVRVNAQAFGMTLSPMPG
jgi:hypothetical protein